MRKIAAVILAVILAANPFLSSFAVGNELKIFVASDTHYQSAKDRSPLAEADEAFSEGMLDRDVFSYVSMQGQMNYESGAIMRAMLRAFSASDAPFLLIPGDLTCGKRASHEEFAAMLKETEENTGKKIFVIPGNHDTDDDDFEKYISINEFKKIYSDFGYGEALSSDDKSGCYTAELLNGYRLLAIDSNIYGKDNGKVDSSRLKWIKEQLKTAKNDGVKLIAMMHHSLLPHFEAQSMIPNYRSLATLLADSGVKYVFTGHLHANDITSSRSLKGNVIYDIQTGALITAPC
nr:metallophosphoesterase [Clostridiales bacterium]